MSCHRRAVRLFSTTLPAHLRKVVEKTQGAVTTIEVAEVPEERKTVRYIPEAKPDQRSLSEQGACQCVLCSIPAKISYSDILILEQFMRSDGTVLPRQLTGICLEQQERLERCVMQAHWSGLFPDRPNQELDLKSYRRFNRYWKDDTDLFKLKLKKLPGSWFCVQRYNPRMLTYKRREGKTPWNEGKDA